MNISQMAMELKLPVIKDHAHSFMEEAHHTNMGF